MENFETVVARHGETGAQAILENWERFAGVCYAKPTSLEKRWDRFVKETDTRAHKVAA